MTEQRCENCMHYIQGTLEQGCIERNTVVTPDYTCPDWKQKQVFFGKYNRIIDHSKENGTST